MPTKPETILKKIDLLPDHQSKLCLQYKEWLEYDNDNSERNWINYLKVLNMFVNDIENKSLEEIKREDKISKL